jgi:hypothetical protein
MARIRTIKPEFWSDASVISLPYEYRLLFQGLWNFADDAGFIENRADQIKIHVFPADEVDITKGIRALKKAEMIEVIRLDGKNVIHVLNWKKHQRIDKPQPSRFAPLYDDYQASRAIPGTFQERSQNVPAGKEGKGRERKGKEVTQVGGGGHLSSDTDPTTAELSEPWRCIDHQGVDVPCMGCKSAKAAWKAKSGSDVDAKRARESKARRESAKAVAAAIAACDYCDEKGYTPQGRPCALNDDGSHAWATSKEES